ncbi:MAG: ABC transporter ATP-binding protein [Patescibacteria group bacterium]
MQPLIQLRDIRKKFVNDEVVTSVLHGISLDINQGEFVAIMGPSGSGKSTLMHIMSFLDRITSGDYKFEGKDADSFSDDELAKLRLEEVGFVFQFFYLLQNATVLSNVMLPLVYAGVSNSERKKAATQALKNVKLEHRLNHLSNQLSGGEKQRVAIARAIVNNPAVIFADEPTGNLDTKSGTEVLEILSNLNKQGHTIIMVTHEQEAAEYAKRVIKIRDGKIEGDSANGSQRAGGYNK